MKPEKKAEYLERMKQLAADYSGDPEAYHNHADALLLELLTELGFEEIITVYNSVEHWYA